MRTLQICGTVCVELHKAVRKHGVVFTTAGVLFVKTKGGKGKGKEMSSLDSQTCKQRSCAFFGKQYTMQALLNCPAGWWYWEKQPNYDNVDFRLIVRTDEDEEHIRDQLKEP